MKCAARVLGRERFTTALLGGRCRFQADKTELGEGERNRWVVGASLASPVEKGRSRTRAASVRQMTPGVGREGGIMASFDKRYSAGDGSVRLSQGSTAPSRVAKASSVCHRIRRSTDAARYVMCLFPSEVLSL
jgi:hypothetical protein